MYEGESGEGSLVFELLIIIELIELGPCLRHSTHDATSRPIAELPLGHITPLTNHS